jgi:hypothetical protein
LEERRTSFNRKLCDDSYSCKHLSVPLLIMAEGSPKNIKLLESAVDCFMTRPNSLLLIRISITTFWMVNCSRLSPVTKICFSPLPCLFQQLIQRLSVDLEVWPLATRKRTVDPNYIPTVNGNSDFPTEPCTSKLEAVPLFVKNMGVVDLEISSIDRDQAQSSTPGTMVAIESIVPQNLLKKLSSMMLRIS